MLDASPERTASEVRVGGAGRVVASVSTFPRRTWEWARRFQLRLWLRPQADEELVRLGSDYGGWIVPRRLLRPGAICYCAGVGEDATFDLELIRHGCLVVSIDPTPRAIQYGEQVARDQPAFNLVPVGLWSAPAVLRFYVPRDPAQVSHSVVNLQGTADYFEAECTTVQLLAERLGHDHLDLLKLDIEGAEHEVLGSVLRDGPLPGMLCVEFDQPAPMAAIRRTVKDLRSAGYRPVAIERWNVTFCRTR